ncbi:MAG: helix-hairpin-helix domain-containing protein, partial [Clostridium sp.]
LNKNNDESIFVDAGADNTSNENVDNNYGDKFNSQNSSKESNPNISSPEKIKEKTIIVEIKGEVKHPDVYTLDENSIINDLINLAGGVTENADLSSINRAKKLQDHEMIYIADKNNEKAPEDAISSKTDSTENAKQIININSATIEELKSINGIGESKAKSIVEYREQTGGFKSVEEIKNVDGIGEKMFEKIKESITV